MNSSDPSIEKEMFLPRLFHCQPEGGCSENRVIISIILKMKSLLNVTVVFQGHLARIRLCVLISPQLETEESCLT